MSELFLIISHSFFIEFYCYSIKCKRYMFDYGQICHSLIFVGYLGYIVKVKLFLMFQIASQITDDEPFNGAHKQAITWVVSIAQAYYKDTLFYHSEKKEEKPEKMEMVGTFEIVSQKFAT